MSPVELSDRQLDKLLGQVAAPGPPAAGLADRIVARALRTPQARGSLFQIPAGNRLRRRPLLLSAVIAANVMAVAAAAASWNGQQFDFHRLIDLPQRVASAVHIGHHHHSTQHDELPHVVPRAAPHFSPVSRRALATAPPSAPISAEGRGVVRSTTMVVPAMPPLLPVRAARAEHARQAAHPPSVSKHPARLMKGPHLSSHVRVRMQHIASAQSADPVRREVAPKAQLERTLTTSSRATEEWGVGRQAAPAQQAAPEIRSLNHDMGSKSRPPAAEERRSERDWAALTGTRRRLPDRLMFRRAHPGVGRTRFGRKF